MAAAPGFGKVADELRRVTVQVLDARGLSAGAGVIATASSVVTNAHVVTSTRLQVRLPSGALFEAAVQKQDRGRDLAVLRLNGCDSLQPATLRETASLRSGDRCSQRRLDSRSRHSSWAWGQNLGPREHSSCTRQLRWPARRHPRSSGRHQCNGGERSRTRCTF
jgi:hypothetical protein